MTGLDDLSEAISAFHLIRPMWLLLLPIIVLLWWRIRSRAGHREQPLDSLAPHLREALTLGLESRRKLVPIDGVAVVLALAALGASGPTWSRIPEPFLARTSPMVIVLKVTPSMLKPDIAPTRLERAKYKIRDLLAVRAGARTALIAYAGTAHRVVPFTEDPSVMLPFLEGLSPDTMPREGDNARAAFEMAQDLLETQETPGGILFILDSLAPSNVTGLRNASLAFLAMLPEGIRDRGLDLVSGAPVVQVTPDDRDVRQIDRSLSADYRKALLENENQPWDDRGWWLAWPAALLTMIWFRRGWTMRWALALFIAVGASGINPARADTLSDWFFTPDQQGQRAFDNKDFSRAAELFNDPVWKGYALYRAGQYQQAIDLLAGLDTARASFTQGLAHVKNRQYRDAVRAFETTLQRDADYPGAAENLQTAQQIVDYIERVREQSDTGEERGIGADDVVFDNETGRGADTQIDAKPREGEGLVTTEQWMNMVDTRTEDFLRLRFLIEAGQETP